VYDGFARLAKAGVIDLTVKRASGDSDKPILTVIVNGKYRVVYDTLDGLNWIEGSTREANLGYFANELEWDFYFKRSCNQDVTKNIPQGKKVYPLGLNYSYRPEGEYPYSIRERAIRFLRDTRLASAFYGRVDFRSADFEHYPVPSGLKRILFLARLWDPDTVVEEALKTERETINRRRVECIRACREEFGDRFVGGIQDDAFARRYAQDLIIPSALTERSAFLDKVKESDICIATTGLHDSIGWKFAEYVAAARAIVSEPLKYELPGDFAESRNYLSFETKEELVSSIRRLSEDAGLMQNMMNENFRYYQTDLRSDMLILRTLLRVNDELSRNGSPDSHNRSNP
jgi:hypothetical protein